MAPSETHERHKDLELYAKSLLEKEGYSNIKLEHSIEIEDKQFRVDLIGEKQGKKVIVECGSLDAHKLSMLLVYYDVLHVGFDKGLKWFFKDAKIEGLLIREEKRKDRQQIIKALAQKMTKEEKIEYSLMSEQIEELVLRRKEISKSFNGVLNEEKPSDRDQWGLDLKKTYTEFWELTERISELEDKQIWLLLKVGSRNYPSLLTFS